DILDVGGVVVVLRFSRCVVVIAWFAIIARVVVLSVDLFVLLLCKWLGEGRRQMILYTFKCSAPE
ncbi:hypothetical protein OFB58_27485, partial [Escherichia coli]|nr:hypothetical protein [Escherichia coli]